MSQTASERSAAIDKVKASLEEQIERKDSLPPPKGSSGYVMHQDGKLYMTSAPPPGHQVSQASIVSKKPKKKKTQILSHAISGTMGAVAAETFLFPVDTIKIQVQTYTGEDAGGVLATALRIIRTKGFGGFYAGFQGAVIKESIHSANFWLFHGLIFSLATKQGDGAETSVPLRLLLNLLAKQLNWLCTVPFEVVSSVNQITKDSPGLISTAKTLYETGGLAAFYRGLGVSMALAINPAIMNTGITFFLAVFRLIRKLRGIKEDEDGKGDENASAVAVGFATGLSKVVATSITYPLIRAKVVQQTYTGANSLGLMGIIRDTIRTDGFFGLYRGIIAMSFKTVLWNALMMGFKKVLDPKKAITPPTTPGSPAAMVNHPMSAVTPFFARETFPVELVTAEKIHEILQVLHLESQSKITPARVEALEDRMTELSDDLRKTNQLLGELVKGKVSQSAQ